MTLSLNLSTASINKAIRQLTKASDDLNYAVNDLVESLAYDGAEVAQSAYGNMAAATAQSESMTQAKIVASGGDQAIIAEFGAGYATMEYHPFAKNAPVPIEPTSYSRDQYPYGLFYISDSVNPGEGYWFFGGKEYDRVQPRHGLLNAYDYINEHYLEIWKEVSRI